ncbi:MAG TPA: type II toxin-antitoxin system VapC family toxin [Deltaproteobacteria bacterium]|nr:type II toxin-antitoxin system VapC family toxin [Deltaproteobacteria bacterium]HQI81329.1 type II toxin-antitoxin system VapC family toxin [Deltaproteobacteria bacterium]
MRYLLDTNICIFIIKQQPIQVVNRLRRLSPGDAAVSAVTVAELEYGAAKSSRPEQNREALLAFTTPLEVIPFDDHATMHYGEIRWHLERKGLVIGAMDMLIAAQARSRALTLVTNNLREFKRIPDLQLEDWTKG